MSPLYGPSLETRCGCSHLRKLDINRFRFDFPMLLSEAWRKRASLDALTEWYYADSLAVFNALGAASLGGCVKLQCLVRSCAAEHLRAHRALDDAIALQAVAHTVAARTGLSTAHLFAPFATQLDLEASVAELSALCVRTEQTSTS